MKIVIIKLKFIPNDNFLNIIIDILKKLFTDFINEMEKYYYILIPIFLNILKKNKYKETKSLLHIFLLMSENENIVCYLNIMMDELCEELLIHNDEAFIKYLLEFFKKIIIYDNCNTFFPIIINILLRKIK